MAKEQDYTCDMIEVRHVRCRYLVRASSPKLAELQAMDGRTIAELPFPNYELWDRRLVQITEGREKYDRTQPPPADAHNGEPRPLCGVELSDRSQQVVRELHACVTLSGGDLSEQNLLGMSLGEILSLCENDKILFQVRLSSLHSRVSDQV